MFERYTESARRVLFFARYEASQTGSLSIETEHLLAGLLREEKGAMSRILRALHVPAERLRQDYERRAVFQEKVPTSVEIPFGRDTQIVLQFTAEEADRLFTAASHRSTFFSHSCDIRERWRTRSSRATGSPSTRCVRRSYGCSPSLCR